MRGRELGELVVLELPIYLKNFAVPARHMIGEHLSKQFDSPVRRV